MSQMSTYVTPTVDNYVCGYFASEHDHHAKVAEVNLNQLSILVTFWSCTDDNLPLI